MSSDKNDIPGSINGIQLDSKYIFVFIVIL